MAFWELFYGICFCAIFLSHPAKAERSFLDIVFDLDNTIRQQVFGPAGEAKIARENPGATFLRVGGTVWWVYPEVSELLQSLSRNPKIRGSFFTAASREDMDSFLDALKLPNGKSAKESSYVRLCGDDLHRPEEEELTQANGFRQPRGAGRPGESPRSLGEYFGRLGGGKDLLSGKIPGIKASRAILVEDHANQARRKQEANVLYVGFKDVERSDPPRPPRITSIGIENGKKARFIGGVLSRVMDLTGDHGDVRKPLWSLQWIKADSFRYGPNQWTPTGIREEKGIYDLGGRLLSSTGVAANAATDPECRLDEIVRPATSPSKPN